MKNGRAPKPAAELVAYLQESVALLTDPEGPQDAEGRALLVANVLTECEGAWLHPEKLPEVDDSAAPVDGVMLGELWGGGWSG
jgi:hypothetical protein